MRVGPARARGGLNLDALVRKPRLLQSRSELRFVTANRESASMPSDTPIKVEEVTLVVRTWPALNASGWPPVVLLPATGETAEDWDLVASFLSRSRTVYAVNLRGHGRSDWPGTYSIQLMADDVRAVLDHIGGRPVDLVGHSLGGLVACSVAADRPDLVRRLVLEDVGLLKPRPADPPARPAGDLRFDWRVVEQVRPEIDNFDPGWTEVVHSIVVRTLVVAGGPSSPVPQEQVADLARVLRDSEIVTIDTGHLVHSVEPEEFTHCVQRFLNE